MVNLALCKVASDITLADASDIAPLASERVTLPTGGFKHLAILGGINTAFAVIIGAAQCDISAR